MPTGKYKAKDKKRPIVMVRKGQSYFYAIIIQEIDKSYLFRKINFQFNDSKDVKIVLGCNILKSEWQNKNQGREITEIGVYDFSNGEEIRLMKEYDRSDLKFKHYICPNCDEKILSFTEKSHGAYTEICPVCRRVSNKENFEMFFSTVNRIMTDEVEKERKEEQKSCPGCGKSTKDYIDELNKIKKCMSCNIYYVD